MRILAAILAAAVATIAQAKAGPTPAGPPGGFNSGTGYTAPGAPTARSSASRAGDVVNVKDWGAKGDGIADDTAAVAAAVAAATDEVVFFPAGTYLVSGLTVRSSVVLRGAGWKKTILRNTSASTPTLTIASPVGFNYMTGGTTVENLQINGTSTGAAVQYDTQSRAVLRNVYIAGNYSRGIWLAPTQHAYGLTVDHCYISVSGDGVYGRSEPARQVNAINILGGTEIQACGGHGVNLWANVVSIRDSIIEGNAGAGIYLNADDMATGSASIDTFNVTDNYIEANQGGAVAASTTYNAGAGVTHYALRVRVQGNHINQTSAAVGVTAAIVLDSTNGAGGASGVLSSYKGSIIGPNTYFTSALGWVDFRGRNDSTVTLVSPAPYTGLGPGTFAGSFLGLGGVNVQGDRHGSGTGEPSASADYLGQWYLQTSPLRWWRAVATGGGTADWLNMAGLRGSLTYDIGSIAAGVCATDIPITVTGAAAGAECAPGWPSALPAGLLVGCYVSAAGTVKLRVCNHTAGAIDPPSLTYTVRLFNP